MSHSEAERAGASHLKWWLIGALVLVAEAHDVDVVVLDALVGRVDVVAERGPDAGDLVGRDAGSDAGPADHDRPLGLAAPDRVADQPGQVREVDRLGRV